MSSDFYAKVYALCRRIPRGKVTTYKEIGQALGTKAYRAIGQALRRNPDAPRTPCHRVVSSIGQLHGFKGSTRSRVLSEKQRLLEKEGVPVVNGQVDLKQFLFEF